MAKAQINSNLFQKSESKANRKPFKTIAMLIVSVKC